MSAEADEPAAEPPRAEDPEAVAPGEDEGEPNPADWRELGERLSEQWEPVAEAIPGLLRITATSMLRTAEWSATAGAETTQRTLAAAVNPASAAELAAGAAEVAQHLAELAGKAGDLAREVAESGSVSEALVLIGNALAEVGEAGPKQRRRPGADVDDAAALRVKAARLLERSRDVRDPESGHPAHSRILDELLPDEVRILVLFMREGPQPSVDVRSGGVVGAAGSTLLASNLTMVGARAGVKWLDRVPSYLHNLLRLGLVWFSHEQLLDPLEYQVLEVQPDVLAAWGDARRHRVVRRSIHLTPFGDDFCRVCFQLPDSAEHDGEKNLSDSQS